MGSGKRAVLTTLLVIFRLCRGYSQTARVEYVSQPCGGQPIVTVTPLVQAAPQLVIPAIIKPILQPYGFNSDPAPSVPNSNSFNNNYPPFFPGYPGPMPPIIFDRGDDDNHWHHLLYFLIFALRNRRGGGYGGWGGGCGGGCGSGGGCGCGIGCGDGSGCGGGCGSGCNCGGGCGGDYGPPPPPTPPPPGDVGGYSGGWGNGCSGGYGSGCGGYGCGNNGYGSGCIFIPYPIPIPINSFSGFGSGYPMINGGWDGSGGGDDDDGCRDPNEINLIIRTDQNLIPCD